MVLADKGYQGHGCCLSPFRGKNLTPDKTSFNELLASVRQIVECVFSRVKIFNILRGRYRAEIESHYAVMNVCCQLTNLSLERNPVYAIQNPYL